MWVIIYFLSIQYIRLDFIVGGGLGDLTLLSRSFGSITETPFERLEVHKNNRDEAMNVTENFPKKLKTKLSLETKQYFETGNCSSSKHNRRAAINPTLLEPGTLRWRVDPYSCPFDSYLPLHLDQLEVSAEEGVVTRYCQKTLKKMVAVYIENRNNVSFNFHLNDALQFCIDGTSEKFDVIDCSSLADEVGMANLILSSKNVLELHPEAMLLANSFQWHKTASTVALYLEDCLCAPLSMIPTIYGLRLAYPVELGSPTLLQVDRSTGYEFPSATLIWHRTLRSENLPVSHSPMLERCLKNLEDKCYFMDNQSDFWLGERRLLSYTPLTFDFVVIGLAQHNPRHCQKKLLETHLSSRFVLARKTLEDWIDSQPLTLLTGREQILRVFGKFYSKKKLFVSSMLRLVLAPIEHLKIFASLFDCENLADHLPINWADELPDVHYLDNFNMCYENSQEGRGRLPKVSFLLPRNHGLNTHCGILIDTRTGFPLIFLGLLKDMNQEAFDKPHPIKTQTPSVSEDVSPGPTMKVVNCKEDVTSYAVEINIEGFNDFQGKFFL